MIGGFWWERLGSECGIVDWIDVSWMMRRSCGLEVGDGCSYTFLTLLVSFRRRLGICVRLCCDSVVSL